MPPSAAYIGLDSVYQNRYSTYSEYNYLRPGIISKLKRRRFDVALSLARQWFGKVGAVDMGCADGILLHSLAHYFPKVLGCDLDQRFCDTAANSTSGLSNVRVVRGSAEAVGSGYGLMFLLEVLEHVGNSPASMYQDKVEFLRGLFGTLDSPKIIIASVPRMVGPLFLLKYLIQEVTGMHKEELSGVELIQCGLFGDTDSLVEKRWSGGHIGFNENKLTAELRKHFSVKVKHTLTSVFYVLQPLPD
jgi:hypothetical protein